MENQINDEVEGMIVKGKRMKRLAYILMCVLCILLTACGKKKTEQKAEEQLKNNEIYMYYVNVDFTDVVKQKYSIQPMHTVTENAKDIIVDMAGQKGNENIQSPIPEAVEYVSVEFDEWQGRLTVTFQILYDEVQPDSLLFFKTCVVKTLLQLENVDTVAIALTDMASSDAETATVTENFDSDSFAMSFGNSNGYQQKGNIVLYFATPDGENLKEYYKSVEISNNTSLAEIVVAALIEGPQQDGYQATIPENTTIRNISVKDGICYVDFSDEFYDTENTMRNDIIVYSIVNSLAELPTVTKVQFLKNGEKLPFYRGTMPFDVLFERNLDLIEHEGDEKSGQEETEQEQENTEVEGGR